VLDTTDCRTREHGLNKGYIMKNNENDVAMFDKYISQKYNLEIMFDRFNYNDLDSVEHAQAIQDYNDGKLWNVALIATDIITGESACLGNIATEEMCETDEATASDLDAHGLEIALELFRELDMGETWFDGKGNIVNINKDRSTRLAEHAAELRAQADSIDALAITFSDSVKDGE